MPDENLKNPNDWCAKTTEGYCKRVVGAADWKDLTPAARQLLILTVGAGAYSTVEEAAAVVGDDGMDVTEALKLTLSEAYKRAERKLLEERATREHYRAARVYLRELRRIAESADEGIAHKYELLRLEHAYKECRNALSAEDEEKRQQREEARLRTAIESEREEAMHALTKADNRHEREMTRLKKEHEKTMESLKRGHEQTLTQKDKEHQSALAQKDRELRASLTQKDKEYKQRLAETQREWKQRLTEDETEWNRLLAEKEKELKQATKEHEKERKKLEKRVEKLESDKKKAEAEVRRLRRKAKEKREAAKAKETEKPETEETPEPEDFTEINENLPPVVDSWD